MATGKPRLGRLSPEKRAACWFAGGFVVAMVMGQLLDERHCTFDLAHEKPLLNWAARLCSDIRVTSKDLSDNGGTLTVVPRRGALEEMFNFID